MLEPRSAEIIPFPGRPPATERSPPRGPERLSEALAALDGALAAQRRAIGEWRGALADLRMATRGLGESVHAYRDGLGTLGARVAALRAKTAELASRADHAFPRRT